jgi:tetratricopeptide (TPR) repeat protein
LKQQRTTEAISTANEAMTLLPKCARALALTGKVITNMPNGQKKAEEYFLTALELQSTCINAVYGLAELYEKTDRIELAIAVLEKYIPVHHCDGIHVKLGQVYLANGDYPNALKHFNAALRCVVLTLVLTRYATKLKSDKMK